MLQIDGKVNPKDLNGVYRDIAEAFDVETACKFHEYFSGLQLTFPIRLMSKEYVLNRLEIEYDGCNLKELSKKFGYSERWLRALMKEQNGKEDEGE